MSRKQITMVLVLVALVAGGVFMARRIERNSDATLQGSGTVEARYIRVGSKVGGRVDKVLVREGDSVHGGQVLVTFDDKELQAALGQSRAAWEKAHTGSRPEDIAQARAATAEAQAEYEQRKNGYRREDVAAAQADLDRATAEEVRTHNDFVRYDALSKKDLVSRQQRDAAEAAWKMAAAQQKNAQEQLSQLQRGYRPEEIAAAEARYRQMEATQQKFERGNRIEDVELAKAAYNYDEARAREAQVVSPSEASVEVLDIRPGDLIAPNVPVATLTRARPDLHPHLHPRNRNWPRASRPASGSSRRLFPQNRFQRRRRTDKSASRISSSQRADPQRARPPGHRHKSSRQ